MSEPAGLERFPHVRIGEPLQRARLLRNASLVELDTKLVTPARHRSEKPIRIHRPDLESHDTVPNRCALCGSTTGEVVRTFFVNGDRFTIIRCPNDGLMYANPRPGPEYLRSIYGDRYYKDKDELVGGTNMYDEKAQEEKVAKKIADISRHVPPGARVHDVGSGFGHLAAALTERGYRVTGNDIGKLCVEESLARGVAVHEGELATAAEALELHDLDAMFIYDVLEHMPDPNRELGLCHGMLKDGGILIVRVPCTPPDGPQLNFVDHIWHFDRDTIRTMLEANGFEVIEQCDSGQFIGKNGTAKGLTTVARKRNRPVP